jgi:nucleotidyltransferase substrate binding protein (TIGR01987 family)
MEWTDAVGAFEQALQRFREVLAEPETTVVRDAAIKRFEFTFELGWKATQRFLRAQGIVSRSPKQCLQEAFAFGLVQDNPLWIRMLEDRNLTVHTYDERTAQKIYNGLRDYLPLFEQLHQGLSRHLGTK